MKRIFIVLTLVWFGFISNSFSADSQKGKELLKKGFDAYENGDYAIALKVWLPLAEQGDIEAQYNLGMMYHKGRGIPQDAKEAVKWYRLAAEQGDSNAQTNLGLMYINGDGVIKDIVLAYMWWNIAGDQGRKNAKRNKDILVKEMTESQIEEAQRLVIQCVENNYKGC